MLQGVRKMQSELYSIKQMAEICNVSSRQLRHYDKLGIITPALRDDENGYRFYSKGQVQRVFLLKGMQELGFTLQEISELMQDTGLYELRERVEIQVDSLREKLEEDYKQLQHAENLCRRINKALITLSRTDRNNFDPFYLCEFPRGSVVSKRYVGHCSDNDIYFIRQAEIVNLIEQYHITTTGSHFTIFHDHSTHMYSEEDRDLEAGIQILRADPGCPNIHVYGGFTCLTGVCTGVYKSDYMHKVYQRMYDWAEENDVTLTGSSIEVYIVGPLLTQDPDEYVTQIYLPVEKVGKRRGGGKKPIMQT